MIIPRIPLIEKHNTISPLDETEACKIDILDIQKGFRMKDPLYSSQKKENTVFWLLWRGFFCEKYNIFYIKEAWDNRA